MFYRSRLLFPPSTPSTRPSCLPSPSLSPYEPHRRKRQKVNKKLTPAHPGSSFNFFATQYLKLLANKSMKGVPGVMALESQPFSLRNSSETSLPMAVVRRERSDRVGE